MQKNSVVCRALSGWAEQGMSAGEIAEMLRKAPYFIRMKTDGDFAILNYDPIASSFDVTSGKTLRVDFSDPFVQECRGIVIDLQDFSVACWPFRKFGNYGEPYADTIDWASARVQEKIDGSIIKLWYNRHDARWQFSTNSMIRAEQASWPVPCTCPNFLSHIQNTPAYAHLDFDSLNPELTYIFELTDSQAHVVQYPEDLYHIGTRNNRTGQEYADRLPGLPVPKEYPLRSLSEVYQALEELNKGITEGRRPEHEGFVVVDGHWNRIKIKTREYISVFHRLYTNLSAASLVEAVLAGEADEIRAARPEYAETLDQIESFISVRNREITDAYNTYRRLWNEAAPDRKGYALQIQKQPYASIGFQVAKGADLETVIRKESEARKILRAFAQQNT